MPSPPAEACCRRWSAIGMVAASEFPLAAILLLSWLPFTRGGGQRHVRTWRRCDAGCSMAFERAHRDPLPGLYRSRAIPARAGADLQGTDLDLSVSRLRDRQARRLCRDDDRRDR